MEIAHGNKSVIVRLLTLYLLAEEGSTYGKTGKINEEM
jgi:hypothetical protein